MAVETGAAGVGTAEVGERGGEWFGQPRGLTILFLTDMWEQFSYYGMRALLVYYMVKQLLLGQQQASLVYGLYTAFVYLTPIAGGLIADRWLGRRRAVILGGTIMAFGHFMMAFEAHFYIALATIACGNGLFLPSLPAQINGLYAPDDPRRKSAYNVYYVGINVGGFLAPLVCGTVGEIYGWHWGFTIAGIGMVLGLVIYVLGAHLLPEDRPGGRLVDALASNSQSGSKVAPGQARNQRWMLLAGIALVAIVLRGGYEQIGNTVALWIETTDRAVGSFTIPMTWFLSLNPLLVMTITPWLMARWLRLAKEGREPSSIVKMALGAAIVAASYLLLAAVAAWGEGTATQPSWIWLIAFVVVFTIGELHVLPIGLGLYGRLAPDGYAGTAIALWFLAAFAGNLLAGSVGMLWSHMAPSAFFVVAGSIVAAAALLLLLFNRATSRAEAE